MSSSASPHPTNPRRVAAGRRNGALRGPHSEEGKQRLREAALRNKPWEKSTGPRTPEGKAKTALNAKATQIGPLSVRELRAALGVVAGQIRAMRAARVSIAALLQSARKKRPPEQERQDEDADR